MTHVWGRGSQPSVRKHLFTSQLLNTPSFQTNKLLSFDLISMTNVWREAGVTTQWWRTFPTTALQALALETSLLLLLLQALASKTKVLRSLPCQPWQQGRLSWPNLCHRVCSRMKQLHHQQLPPVLMSRCKPDLSENCPDNQYWQCHRHKHHKHHRYQKGKERDRRSFPEGVSCKRETRTWVYHQVTLSLCIFVFLSVSFCLCCRSLSVSQGDSLIFFFFLVFVFAEARSSSEASFSLSFLSFKQKSSDIYKWRS